VASSQTTFHCSLGRNLFVEGWQKTSDGTTFMRKVGDDVRISVQLINNEGLHVWAANFDHKFEDVLRV